MQPFCPTEKASTFESQSCSVRSATRPPSVGYTTRINCRHRRLRRFLLFVIVSTLFPRAARVRSLCDRPAELSDVIASMTLALVNFMSDRRFFVENHAQPVAVESQTESVFLRELRDFCLSIFLVWRPEPFQLILVNSAVLPFATLQFAGDQVRKHAFIHAIITRLSNTNALHVLAFTLQKLAIR